MAYGIAKNTHGRYVVTSPKGKAWKTTYPTREAAEKGVAYVEGRFGGSGSSPREAAPAKGEYGEDTAQERKDLGVPPKRTEEEDEALEAGW